MQLCCSLIDINIDAGVAFGGNGRTKVCTKNGNLKSLGLYLLPDMY